MNQPELREALVDLTVRFALRELRATTDTGYVTVSEPSIWEDSKTGGPDYGLKVEEREMSL